MTRNHAIGWQPTKDEYQLVQVKVVLIENLPQNNERDITKLVQTKNIYIKKKVSFNPSQWWHYQLIGTFGHFAPNKLLNCPSLHLSWSHKSLPLSLPPLPLSISSSSVLDSFTSFDHASLFLSHSSNLSKVSFGSLSLYLALRLRSC
jgi:hypothetical protein